MPVVDRIYPKSNKFVTAVENRAAGDTKLNDSPKLACNIVRKSGPVLCS